MKIMKKLLFALSLVFAVSTLFAQQVDRNKVILEIGTGTWCTYCPGAAMGADDLIANGHPVAVIENHNGDVFANQFSNARNSYYGISGYPTAKFDGVGTVSGGSHSSSMYSSYLPYVTARLAIPCDFIVELYGTHTGSQYDMLVKAYKVAPYSGPNPVLHLVVTESDIQYSWQGQTELNFVCRQMIPDQNGTVLDFSTSDTVSLNLSFTMGGWPLAHTEFVAFLQNNTTKEALQGIKVPAAFLPPPPQPPVTEFEAVSTENCSGYEVQYTDMSSGDPTVWAWTFPGGTPEISTEQNPIVIYPESGLFDVTLVATNAGGSTELVKPDYMTIVATPDKPSISLIDFVLTSTATEGNQWFYNGNIIGGATEQTYEPMYNGTYTVESTAGNCTSETSNGWDVIWVGIQEAYANQAVKIYPTPNQGRFTLEINTEAPAVLNMKVYDAMNSIVYQEENIQVNGPFKSQVDLGDLSNGIYFMILEGGSDHYFQKIVIQK